MKIDVRTKVLLVCLANLTFLYRVMGWIEWVLIAGLLFLLVLNRKPRLALGLGLFYLVCLLLDETLMRLDLGSFWQMPMTLARASRMMLPSVIAGSLLLTTSTAYDLVQGLRKWRLPEALLLTLAVMMRFLPAIRQDARTIRQNLKLRGIFLKKRDILCHPVRYMEFFMVPLLSSLLRTVDELTMAVMTKGLAVTGQASQAYPSRFRLLDWSVCIWILLMIIWIL